MEFLSKLKSGEFGLAKTYWLFGVIIFLPINILLDTGLLSFEALLLVYAPMLTYLYFWTIGCWIAATNYEGAKIWTILTKIILVINISLTAIGVIMMLQVLINL